jgi:hypothetical protein
MPRSSGYIAGPLPALAPVLRKWIRVNEEYFDRCMGEDAAWWFNERASLSTLAAAAWLAGGIALEEYTTAKSKRGGSVNKNCRCDLFVSLRNRVKGKNDHEFVIEAKIVWPRLASRSLADQIERGNEKARKDVRRTLPYGGSSRVGLLIVSPYMRRSEADRWERDQSQFVEFVRASAEEYAVAWIFAKNGKGPLSERNDHYYPGTAIFLRPLRKST